MKSKIINALLFISSLFGYLEWGGGNQSFLYEAEWDILMSMANNPISKLHPFTILPMVGQIILLISLVNKRPNRLYAYMGIGCIGLLLFFVFIIGIISLNFRIIISCIPFKIMTWVAIRHYREIR